MKKDFGYLGNIIVFGLAGAFGLSLLILFGTWLLAPQMFGDGQYAMSLMVPFALGWVIGAFVGANKDSPDRDTISDGKSLLGLGLVAAGCFASPFVLMFMLMILGLIISVLQSFR